jgi:2-desacetyl-2-hydroxyethyl bacteriochlorophyllide A dehydrogenase
MNPCEIIFPEPGRVECRPMEMPRPCPGQLLVETRFTLLSAGTETTVLHRRYAPGTHWDQWAKFPFRPGYSNCARVIALGDGVEGWKIGDRVAGQLQHASHLTVSAQRISSVPANVSDADAAWVHLGKIVQMGVRAAEHRLGDRVVVIGVGILGQLLVQFAKLSGAASVIAIDTSPLRLRFAAAHGATHTFALPADQALDAVKDATNGELADVVYDVTGHPAVLAKALPLARDFGRVVLLGDTGQPAAQTITGDILLRGVRLLGAHSGQSPLLPGPHWRWSAMQMEQLTLHYLSTGQLRVGDLVTHRAPPQKAAELYDLLERERGNVMGVLVDWTGS